MKKLLVAIIVIVVASIFAVVTINKNKKEPQKPTELYKVRVAYKKTVTSFPIFVGINQGYFKNRGIEIEPVVFESTNQMIEAVVRNDVEASSVGGLEPVLAAEIVSPGNFKFYGQIRWDKNNFVDYVLVKKDSDIKTIQELRGKKIGVPPGGVFVIYTEIFLKNFLNPEEVIIEQLDPKTLVQALGVGSIDAMVGNEPLGTIAIQKGVAKILLERPYTDYVPYIPEIAGVGLMSKKFIEQRPDVAKGFTEAMKESFEYGNVNPEKVKAVLPSCCGVSEDIAPYIPHLGIYTDSKSINREALQKFADFLFEQKIIDKKIDTAPLIYR